MDVVGGVVEARVRAREEREVVMAEAGELRGVAMGGLVEVEVGGESGVFM